MARRARPFAAVGRSALAVLCGVGFWWTGCGVVTAEPGADAPAEPAAESKTPGPASPTGKPCSGCKKEEKPMTPAAVTPARGELKPAPAPDKAAPGKTETATFALG